MDCAGTRPINNVSPIDGLTVWVSDLGGVDVWSGWQCEGQLDISKFVENEGQSAKYAPSRHFFRRERFEVSKYDAEALGFEPGTFGKSRARDADNDICR